MTAFEIVNWTEVFLWPTIGLGCFFASIKKGADRKTLWIVGTAFILFGLSDYIELQTGAWWKPIGLLLLKAGCIAVFAFFGWRHYRATKANNAAKTDQAEG